MKLSMSEFAVRKHTQRRLMRSVHEIEDKLVHLTAASSSSPAAANARVLMNALDIPYASFDAGM